ncbi:hypothetical protein SOVF_050930 [Spinacia oleracea]|nr:hypothetical protein SOVF_050930 [Spinacia oleracea]
MHVCIDLSKKLQSSLQATYTLLVAELWIRIAWVLGSVSPASSSLSSSISVESTICNTWSGNAAFAYIWRLKPSLNISSVGLFLVMSSSSRIP